jgi:hypothetical protein
MDTSTARMRHLLIALIIQGGIRHYEQPRTGLLMPLCAGTVYRQLLLSEYQCLRQWHIKTRSELLNEDTNEKQSRRN